MRGTVVSHLNDAVLEVQCLDLAEGSACTNDLRRELCDRGAQLELSGGRHTSPGQQGRTENHARTEPLVQFAAESAVVVCECVELEVLDELIERDGVQIGGASCGERCGKNAL